MINILICLGLFLSLVNLEIILFLTLETGPVKRFIRKIKNGVRRFFWQIFNFKNDFVEK